MQVGSWGPAGSHPAPVGGASSYAGGAPPLHARGSGRLTAPAVPGAAPDPGAKVLAHSKGAEAPEEDAQHHSQALQQQDESVPVASVADQVVVPAVRSMSKAGSQSVVEVQAEAEALVVGEDGVDGAI